MPINQVPWRYRAPWLKAHLHAQVLDVFQEYADSGKTSSEATHAAFGQIKQFLDDHKDEIPLGKWSKIQEAAEIRAANLGSAYKAVQQVHEHFESNPAELYTAVTGLVPRKVKLVRTPFSINFLMSKKQLQSHHRLLLPDMPSEIVGGVAFVSPPTVSNIRESIGPGAAKKAAEARERIRRKIRRPFDYLAHLVTMSSNRDAVAHEHRHIISSIEDAHRPFKVEEEGQKRPYYGILKYGTADYRRAVKPLFEEPHAYWGDLPADRIPETLMHYREFQETGKWIEDQRARFNLARQFIDAKAIAHACTKEVFANLRQQLEDRGILAPLWRKELNRAEGLAKNCEGKSPESVPKETLDLFDGHLDDIVGRGGILDSAKYHYVAKLSKSIKRVEELQKRHQIPDDVIRQLLQTDHIDTAIAIIEHNTGEKKAA